jgi:ATP/maltotriose-dependent transcriptional regulator MalT
VWAQFAYRRARARALSAALRFDEAEDAARAALAVVGSTDALNDHAATLVALAEALAGCGDDAAAGLARAEAVALYDQKENVAAVALLRAHDGKPLEGLSVRRRRGDH